MAKRNLTDWSDPAFRKKSVTVSAFDRSGSPVTVSGSGFLAATFCHETDHLDGVLFIDKAR